MINEDFILILIKNRFNTKTKPAMHIEHVIMQQVTTDVCQEKSEPKYTALHITKEQQQHHIRLEETIGNLQLIQSDTRHFVRRVASAEMY